MTFIKCKSNSSISFIKERYTMHLCCYNKIYKIFIKSEKPRNMKFTNFLLVLIGILFLNPRIDFQGFSYPPKYIISCSTGWSLQWGRGLIGFYSLEAASNLGINSSRYSTRKYERKTISKQKLKNRIISPCR